MGYTLQNIMPITSSAKKALRASYKKRVYNLRRSKTIEDVTKKIKKLVVAKDYKGASALLPTAYKALDKGVKTDLIKKNASSRIKSRLAKMIRKIK
jgi:small subunit ribosomal protein S20